VTYEHNCEHHARFISYPDAGTGLKPFCTLCETGRLQQQLAEARAANKALLKILRDIRGDLNDMQKKIAGDVGEVIEAAKTGGDCNGPN